MKLCRDCKHAEFPVGLSPFPVGCGLKREPVYGRATPAMFERLLRGNCGPDGRLWEIAPPPPSIWRRILEVTFK